LAARADVDVARRGRSPSSAMDGGDDEADRSTTLGTPAKSNVRESEETRRRWHGTTKREHDVALWCVWVSAMSRARRRGRYESSETSA